MTQGGFERGDAGEEQTGAMPLDFFVHIPKTAGTTLAQILKRQYPRGSVLFVQPPPADHESKVALARSLDPTVRCLSGHLPASLARELPRPYRMFTILRSPLEQLVSNYFYVAAEPSLPGHERIRRGEVTLETFVHKARGRRQAGFLVGLPPGEKVSDEELLTRAKATLEHGLVAFGLTERFDESLVLFNRMLGWKVRGYLSRNRTPERPRLEDLPPDILATLRERVAVDQALYDFAADLFERRLREQAEGFAGELAELRERGAWLRRKADAPEVAAEELAAALDDNRTLRRHLKGARSELARLNQFQRRLHEEFWLPGDSPRPLRWAVGFLRLLKRLMPRG